MCNCVVLSALTANVFLEQPEAPNKQTNRSDTRASLLCSSVLYSCKIIKNMQEVNAPHPNLFNALYSALDNSIGHKHKCKCSHFLLIGLCG